MFTKLFADVNPEKRNKYNVEINKHLELYFSNKEYLQMFVLLRRIENFDLNKARIKIFYLIREAQKLQYIT